jgi:hypothetical protein
MNDIAYIRDEDRQEYRNFCIHHLRQYGRPIVAEVWHYTTADGLMAILKSGKIFSTQVTCLNDNLEQRYFGDLVHEAVKQQIIQNTDSNVDVLLRLADKMLGERDFSTAWHFVACFSEVEDDLGQWRGYGGGECGYAIGFRSDGLLEALKARPSALFLPMHYTGSAQQFVVNDVLRMAQTYFLDGINKCGFTDIDRWAREFLMAFAIEMDIFASMTKHPKFSSEMERRITTSLQTGENKDLEFRQKRTLLARHLPIDLTVDAGGERKLPITSIYIGPGPAKRVSQVSVGDLLLKHGYAGVPVKLSAVPYRIP